jgi:hypothetical protein
MKIICRDRIDLLSGSTRTARGVSSVASDLDAMFSSKSYSELVTLEKQIRTKLDSDHDIDVDYWEHLLKTLLSWKAKAKLRHLSAEILSGRLQSLRKEQVDIAELSKMQLLPLIDKVHSNTADQPALDPDSLLALRPEDKGRDIIDESEYLIQIAQDRQKIIKLAFIPTPKHVSLGQPVASSVEDGSRAMLLYNREAAKGVDEDEEVFASEESVDTASKPQWAGKHQPRKPKYFNRVQMGYEWNKYNQTHYDQDNPPPKVVQGYKFNIFYPDLIDVSKAPTYKIQREGGRKRGESFARAGEEDTCLIRFIAGAPYEDIAFRIVDREWDYSAKYERGFKSSFEKASHERCLRREFF